MQPVVGTYLCTVHRVSVLPCRYLGGAMCTTTFQEVHRAYPISFVLVLVLRSIINSAFRYPDPAEFTSLIARVSIYTLRYRSSILAIVELTIQVVYVGDNGQRPRWATVQAWNQGFPSKIQQLGIIIGITCTAPAEMHLELPCSNFPIPRLTS